ncbi:MAG TPA: hypothetical protein VFX88_04495 [Actinomycetota bacterium]|jgi:hypothetical protein|nr:hypothetical protein [Actinomycetota bacterium]
MKGRTVLLVVAVVVVVALVGYYAGMSSSTPKAAADPAGDPPGSSVEIPQTDGSGPPRPPAGSRTGSGGPTSSSNGSVDKGSVDKGSAPKKGGNQSGTTTLPGKPPPKPPTSQPPPQAGPVRFGRVTASGRGSETSIAPDRRALTTTFSDFEVTVDPEPAEPDPTKTFTMTMPLTTGRGGETLSVYAQGFIFLDGGAKASVTLQGGGRQIIQGYATGADDSFLQTLELPARPGVTYQLTFAIDIDRGADAEGTGYLNIAAIDIGIH